jgi:ABC-type transporter Mla subunit MlaD
LYRGTRAMIGDKSLLGGKMIELFPPPQHDEGNIQLLGEDELIPGDLAPGLGTVLQSANDLLPTYSSRIDQVLIQVEELVAGLKTTVDRANLAIDDVRDLKGDVSETLSAYRVLAGDLTVRIERLTATVEGAADEIVPATVALEREYLELAQQLKRDIADMKESLDSTMQRADSVLSGADGLINDHYAELSATLDGLQRTVYNAEILTRRLAEKPNRLLFGKEVALPPNELSDREIAERDLRESGKIGRRGVGGEGGFEDLEQTTGGQTNDAGAQSSSGGGGAP